MKSAVTSLYDYQNDIMRRLSAAWQRYCSVMVQMPTGTGKTVVLAAVVNEELGTGREESGVVYIVAHRRELVAQIEETVERFGIGTDAGCVRVMSIQWLSRHLDDVGPSPHLVVIDEAHHAVADTYRMLWDRYPRARFLGLTATPCRMKRSGFTDLFDTLIASWSIAEFIERGYLSAFDYVSLRRGSRVTIPPIYRKIKSPVGKYCAVEKNYSKWRVVALDGTVMIEPKYSEIDINMQGIVTGTKVMGSNERVKLP